MKTEDFFLTAPKDVEYCAADPEWVSSIKEQPSYLRRFYAILSLFFGEYPPSDSELPQGSGYSGAQANPD